MLRSQGSTNITHFFKISVYLVTGRERLVSRIPGTLGRILASPSMHRISKNIPVATHAACRWHSPSSLCDAGCLHKKRNWVTMNEQCSWCSREGGLGNSSRSRSPDSAGMGVGLSLVHFPGLEKYKITRKIFFGWGGTSLFSAVPKTRVLLHP